MNNRGQTVIPIFIQQPSREPEECPSCHKTEDIIEVCAHCGYKYPEGKDDLNGWHFLWVIFLAMFSGYILITLGSWTFANYSNQSLVEIIQDQWHWLPTLRIW